MDVLRRRGSRQLLAARPATTAPQVWGGLLAGEESSFCGRPNSLRHKASDFCVHRAPLFHVAIVVVRSVERQRCEPARIAAQPPPARPRLGQFLQARRLAPRGSHWRRLRLLCTPRATFSRRVRSSQASSPHQTWCAVGLAMIPPTRLVPLAACLPVPSVSEESFADSSPLAPQRRRPKFGAGCLLAVDPCLANVRCHKVVAYIVSI